jgi:hypothetical protein
MAERPTLRLHPAPVANDGALPLPPAAVVATARAREAEELRAFLAARPKKEKPAPVPGATWEESTWVEPRPRVALAVMRARLTAGRIRSRARRLFAGLIARTRRADVIGRTRRARIAVLNAVVLILRGAANRLAARLPSAE